MLSLKKISSWNSNSIFVFCHKWDESLRSCFRLQKIWHGPFNTNNVYLSNFQFCFRLSWAHVVVGRNNIGYSSSTHLPKFFLHLEESSCSSNMICSGNHSAVKYSPPRKLGHWWRAMFYRGFFPFLDRIRPNYNGLKDNDFFRLETSDAVEIKTVWRTVVYE